jgi:thiol:disulfide interchange protein
VRNFASILLAALVLWPTGIARAQNQADPFAPPPEFGGIVGQFDGSARFGEPVSVDAQVLLAQGDRPAVLVIIAKVAPGKHIYSLTQPPGGPNPTRIVLTPSTEYRLLGPFKPQPAPKSHKEQGPVWTGLEIQEHEGEVAWYAPIETTAGENSSAIEIHGTLRADACETGGSCIPVEKEFAARVTPNSPIMLPTVDYPGQAAVGNSQSAVSGTYQARGSSVKVTGRIEPAIVRPGESAHLVITATPSPGWHVYAHSLRDNKPGSEPTLIAIARADGLIPEAPTTDAPVNIDDSVPQFGPMRYHEGTVTWKLALNVPPGASPGEFQVGGLVGYQACESRENGGGTCELPLAARFAGTVRVGSEAAGGSAPLSFAPANNYREAATLAAVFADYLDRQSQSTAAVQSTVARTTAEDRAIAAESQRAQTPVLQASDAYELSLVQVDGQAGSLGYYVALAFVGGLILNLMPCVLPVIGLKVMSFVEQSGRSRTHALVLNLWYAAGIVVVFLLLGILAATINLSWGGQFGSTAFNVTIAAVVFAMALSLLGVWEVPIPGFFGSGSVQSAAAQEGPLGAFLKGIVTTILATPCTAPFMASAVAWAVAQPFATTLAVFASLGIGMASPYVLVGVYPELLRFLPKPGRWMETFKQVTGFVLLATVVFILSFIEPAAVVPTVALLLGIGVACWLISRTPMTAEFNDRIKSWAVAVAVLLLFVGVSFGVLYRIASERPETAWQPFSLEKLKRVAVDDGKTVLVDFSAEWCLNCKFFEKTVLHTEPVKQAIARFGAVPMYADFTDYPPEIDRTLKALRSNGVPVIAVFPGNAPYQPIVFRGSYSQQDLINALQRAAGVRPGRASEAVAASPTVSQVGGTP